MNLVVCACVCDKLYFSSDLSGDEEPLCSASMPLHDVVIPPQYLLLELTAREPQMMLDNYFSLVAQVSMGFGRQVLLIALSYQ